MFKKICLSPHFTQYSLASYMFFLTEATHKTAPKYSLVVQREGYDLSVVSDIYHMPRIHFGRSLGTNESRHW